MKSDPPVDSVFRDRLRIAEARLAELLEGRAQLEARWQSAEQRADFLQTIIDCLPELIFAKDADFRLVLVNDEFCKRNGLTKDEALGKTAHDLKPTAIADRVRQLDTELLATGTSVRCEETMVDGAGQETLVDTIKVPLRDGRGTIVGIAAVSRDITEQKREEEERRRNVEQLKQLLSTIERQKQQLEAANAELERISLMDPLTGLANRRHFEDVLAREWNRARRGSTALTLMMIDIDFFKAYNDRYGHVAGDACLRRVSQALREAVNRSGDFLARFGGEEFVVILPATDDPNRTVANRCLQAVRELAIPHDRSTAGEVVTVSIGLAKTRPDDAVASDTLIRAADERLYEAKKAGRNRLAGI